MFMNRTRTLLLLSSFLWACGDDGEGSPTGTADAATPDAGSDAAPGADIGAGADAGAADTAGPDVEEQRFPDEPLEVIGGERPATVTVPLDYDAAESWPAVLLLHGFGASGVLQDRYLGVSAIAEEMGLFVVVPDGTPGADGQRFWNGTPACCDFARVGVDDVAYARGLIEELATQYNIDSTRVYALGHSNGGFMSYRLACEASDVFVAIASLAGASFMSEDQCMPATEPVSVLQVHGTDDETIAYEGGNLGRGLPEFDYPSALETVRIHASLAGCQGEGAENAAGLDLEVSIPGSESSALRFDEGCAADTVVELWTIAGGAHIPNLSPTGTRQMLEWLLQRSR